MQNEWYLKAGDKEVGPLSAPQLKTMADRGQISPGDPVKLGSEGRWVPASSVRGLLSPGEFSTEQSGPIPVARRLEEPPPPPQRGPTSETEPPPSTTGKPLDAVEGEIPAARAVAATPDGASSPPSADQFRIVTGKEGPLGRYAGPRASRTVLAWRRNKDAIVVVAVLLVALAGAGALLILSGKGPATAANGPGSEAEKAALEDGKEAGRETDDVVIPELDEYLRQGGLDSAEEGDSEAALADEWTDAAASSVECGDVRIKIASAQIGRPRLVHRSSGRAAQPKSEYLSLRLELYNKNKTKKLEYRSWSVQSAGVTLVDDHKNQYSIKSFVHQGLEPDGQVEGGRGALHPEQPTEDVLVFEKPAGSAKFLRLELPATAFGEEGSLKFEIPISMISMADERDEESMPGESSEFAQRGVDLEAEASPDTGAHALGNGVRESAADRAAASSRSLEAAQKRRLEQAADGGPIDIPGVTDQETD